MSLGEKFKSVKNDFLTDLDDFHTQDLDLTDFRQKYLGRNGLVADLFKMLGKVSNKDRPKYGQELNKLKNEITTKIDSLSVGSIINVPATGKLTVGAWNP